MRCAFKCIAITSVITVVLSSLNLIESMTSAVEVIGNVVPDSHNGKGYIDVAKRQYEDLLGVYQLKPLKLGSNITDVADEGTHVIWMYWNKGLDHLMSLGNQPGKYQLDSICVKGMKYFHRSSKSKWVIKLLDSKTVLDYAPTFSSLVKNKSLPFIQDRLWADLIRLELLSLYGGIWADTSVCPLNSFDKLIETHLDTRKNSFFAPVIPGPIAFSSGNALPKNASTCHVSKNAAEYRSASTWFMAVSNPHNPLIDEWLRILVHHLTTLSDPNKPYFITHCSLTQARMYNETVDKIWRSSVKFSNARQNGRQKSREDNVCFDHGSFTAHRLKTHCTFVKKQISDDVKSFFLGEYLEYIQGEAD